MSEEITRLPNGDIVTRRTGSDAVIGIWPAERDLLYALRGLDGHEARLLLAAVTTLREHSPTLKRVVRSMELTLRRESLFGAAIVDTTADDAPSHALPAPKAKRKRKAR